ncbi:hypothetical protein WOLCODRAFT_166415 [Wolfiporia cocos MD-104 SS10]|uniref:C2H2-type domain-containing protein n=1 Tax=Wolfiporia cocos (strain MD-104) TaxID=742152 RepID=A0A2H3JDC5_WOLCO|nr:hypothetical protein WOLCODRAFT_166415 [Wolfiporia cocos MD-104 SS10]
MSASCADTYDRHTLPAVARPSFRPPATDSETPEENPKFRLLPEVQWPEKHESDDESSDSELDASWDPEGTEVGPPDSVIGDDTETVLDKGGDGNVSMRSERRSERSWNADWGSEVEGEDGVGTDVEISAAMDGDSDSDYVPPKFKTVRPLASRGWNPRRGRPPTRRESCGRNASQTDLIASSPSSSSLRNLARKAVSRSSSAMDSECLSPASHTTEDQALQDPPTKPPRKSRSRQPRVFPTRGKHSCTVPGCNTFFGRRTDLKRHMESKHSTRRYRCPYCGMMINRNDAFIRHLRSPSLKHCLDHVLHDQGVSSIKDVKTWRYLMDEPND